MSYNPVSWKLINMYFRDNPRFIVNHHLESYNDFYGQGLSQLLREKNPIHFFKEREVITIDKETKHIGFTRGGRSVPLTYEAMVEHFSDEDEEQLITRWRKGGAGPTRTFAQEEYKYQAKIFLGGKNGDKIYYGKPVIYNEDGESSFMYPNEARLKNMTYAFTIHYDVDIEFTLFLEREDGSEKHYIERINTTVEHLFLGKFPIMLQSNLCILNGLSPTVKFNMGECRNDPGGYFIISGKEKVIISQEKFADNTLYIQENVDNVHSYSAKIRSVSEDASKPMRTLAVKMVAEQPSSTNGQIVVSVPNVRKPIPLFILMRALGVISDKEIIAYCLLDLNKYSHYIEDFRPSIHDASLIFTQTAALKFIATLTKGKTMSHALQILMIYFLPHIGELNFKQKALYLGYIVKRMLKVVKKEEKPTNRDSYIYKRIEISGMLIRELFREYLTQQQNNIYLLIDTKHLYAKRNNPKSYQNKDFMNLITEDYNILFQNRIIEKGFQKAFKGDWGAEAHTKRPGVLQDLSRLSFWSSICQLRKTNVPIKSDGAKVIGPRLLNSTQWGILCPIHTPDGGNVGLHKHLALTTHITSGCSGYPFIEYLRSNNLNMQLLEECDINYLSQTTKIFINGAWIGVTATPEELRQDLILRRRNAIYNPFTSIRWNIERNELYILTDAGRPCHPLLIVHQNEISYEKESAMEKIEENTLTWQQAIQGFGKHIKKIPLNHCSIYSPAELFGKRIDLEENSAIIEYIDTQEMEGVKLAPYDEDKTNFTKNNITHIEIHPSVILGIMANQIIYPSNNPYPRDLFSCGQSKQAVSLYHSNYQNRMDKSAIILHYGQTPIVKSRYYNPITKGEHPYGINAIVAIACYTGYNVEDAVIMNRGALERGLFGTTYLNVYEAQEEILNVGKTIIENKFMNIEDNQVIGLKPGYDYSHLDKISGLIRENTIVNDKTILIGKATTSLISTEFFIDDSVAAKKGQLGYVDKAFMTEGENGERIAKVRIRHNRIPVIGDKFCSRAGQKGTIGIILDECDMPFAANGVRPDIIVNPHAFPSRMTIGHLVESLVGKACLLYGGYGDCTAFLNKGPKDKVFGNLLTQQGFHSSGNEVLYNGMNGQQLEAEIYFGPTYYLRLKHMVKDKINYRARGPRTALTRQTVQGRANNGGLRIGEMDRDALISHGMTNFLTESMMVRGDEFFMAICNKTGTIAIYNKSRNLFLSPMADGPIKFVGNLDGELNIVPISRFGRDFSILHIPYSFKLLLQELQTMNIQMRIITADNVEQLTSLRGSNDLKNFNIRVTQGDISKPIEPATFENIAKVTTDYLNKVNTKYMEEEDELKQSSKEESEALQEERGEEEEDIGLCALQMMASFEQYKATGNLIIICAGDNSYHYRDKWYDERRNYALCVVYYGTNGEIREKYKQTCDIFFHCKGLKWHLIQKILSSSSWWETFNFISFPDDDLTFVTVEEVPAFKQLNLLFKVGIDHKLLLWQPALSGLNTVHDIVKAQSACNYRYVNFVETMTPFFSHIALTKCMRSIMDKRIGIGWGLDYVWATRLISDIQPKGLAIIDKIVIVHTRPVAQAYPKGINPHQEKQEMIQRYNVKNIAAQNPDVFPPGHPYALKTLECVTVVIASPSPESAPLREADAIVPAGLKPGDTFEVQTPDGHRYTVPVPEGAVEGSTLTFDIPPSPSPASTSSSPQTDIFGDKSDYPFYVPPKDPFHVPLQQSYPAVPFLLGIPQQPEESKPLPPPSRYNLRSRQVQVEPSPSSSPSLPFFHPLSDEEGSLEGVEGPSVYIPATPTPSPEEKSSSSGEKESKGGGILKPQRIVLKKDFQKGLSILKSKDDDDSEKQDKEDTNKKIIH